MPIEELTNEEVLQRCAMCATTTRSKLSTLSLGVGSKLADDLDGRTVKLPACSRCNAEEFLIRSDSGERAAPLTYGDLHRLLVDQLCVLLVKQGRFDSRLKTPTVVELEPAVVKEFFPNGFKLPAPAAEQLDPPA